MGKEMLQLSGLECEEALMLIKMALRKKKGDGSPLLIESTSATFHTLLTRWADGTDHVLDPILVPVQGQVWSLRVQAVTHA